MSKICSGRKIRETLQRFAVASSGNVLVVFGLALLPLLGAAGAVIDYSRVSSLRTGMQATLDATALRLAKTAATTSSSDLQKDASDFFNAAFDKRDATNVTVAASYSSSDGGSVTVTGAANLRTQLMSAMGIYSTNFTGRAVAMAARDGKVCVL